MAVSGPNEWLRGSPATSLGQCRERRDACGRRARARPAWPPALPFQPTYFDRSRNFAIRAQSGYVYLRGQADPDDAESIRQMFARYPDAAGARIEVGHVKHPNNPADGWGIAVTWP